MNSTEGYATKAGEADFGAALLLAHGAGAPADSPFMEMMAESLADRGVSVVRFEFPYMQKRRDDGRKRPPDRADKLLACFGDQIERARAMLPDHHSLFIGGKSMGGRMASILASDPEWKGSFNGAVCFGYPFHPPGKLDKWRTGHFGSLWCPLSIQQGTRDPFGKPEELERVDIPPAVELNWLDGGNHDFLPPKKLGVSQKELIQQAASGAAAFMKALM